jgi:hypothetical protein
LELKRASVALANDELVLPYLDALAAIEIANKSQDCDSRRGLTRSPWQKHSDCRSV